jgi:hypothetical protein
MALQQLNLKVPEAVAAHWRVQAAAHGLSVRDWLVSITAPTAPAAAVPAEADLLARVEALEAAVADLQAQTPLEEHVQGQARPLPPPVAAPVALMELPVDAIQTAALADLLGLKRGTLNARISRAGGAREGLVVLGWRCLGRVTPARGGPPQALWVPAAS